MATEDKGMVERFTEWFVFNIPPADELQEAVFTLFNMVPGIAAIFAVFMVFSAFFYLIYSQILARRRQIMGFEKLKTVTFGDASSVKAVGFASVTSVFSILFIWSLATGSSLLPFSLPKPFVGNTQFEYTAINAAGETDNGAVFVNVYKIGSDNNKKPEVSENADGFAKDDSIAVQSRLRKIVRVQNNDDGGKEEGFKVTEVNGQAIGLSQTVPVADGEVFMTPKGSLQFRPYNGWIVDPLYLPTPERVWWRFIDLNNNGYQGVGLWEHLFWSLYRVILGMFLGSLFGIPLGYAMGLSSWLKGWFDPVVEFMRPIPPLALIPLMIIWFGIGEQGKIVLLFLAALWIMTIAARTGVSDVTISKIHAAYSLGASKRQILTKVIVPNSLPQIFTGLRVAMGVCWGTVVAAELVAAEKGIGKMIIAASKFTLTDIIIVGIIIIGIVGMGIEILMRKAEDRLIPWKGKG